jgi:DNA-binding NarL/FixJ family response regulator
MDRYDVVGTVRDGDSLLDAAGRLHPDVIVSDISMPTLSGMEGLRQLRARHYDGRLIFLTMHADARLAAEAFRLGARGFVLKQSSGDELVKAIDEVLEGHKYMSAALTDEVLALMSAPDSASGAELSPRQREVLRLIVAGRRIKEIAAALDHAGAQRPYDGGARSPRRRAPPCGVLGESGGLLRERTDEQLAAQRGVDRRHEVLADPDLQHVAERPGRQSAAQHHAIRVDGGEDDPRRRAAPQDCFRGGDPVDPRHRDVGDDDVGVQPLRRVDEREPVADRPDDVELSLEEMPPSLQRRRVIVGKEHPQAAHFMNLPVAFAA